MTMNLRSSSGECSQTPTPRQPRPSSSLNFHSISARSPLLLARVVTATAEPACGVFDTSCFRVSSTISATEAGLATSALTSQRSVSPGREHLAVEALEVRQVAVGVGRARELPFRLPLVL